MDWGGNMNYTIITTQDLQTGQIIDIVKDGSTYNVDFTNKEKFVTRKVKTLEEAQEIYIKIVNYFINGFYSFEQRAKELEDKELKK